MKKSVLRIIQLGKKLSGVFFILFILHGINLVNGQTLFQKKIGGLNNERFPRVIDAAGSGHIIFGRTNTNSFGNDDFALFKIDSLGNMLWQKHIGTNKRNINKQIIHYKSNYLAVGWLTLYNIVDDLCFMVYDENGSLLKMKSYGASFDDEIMSVAYMGDDKFVFIGESLSFELSGKPDMFISTIDSNLNIEPLTVYYKNDGIVPRKVVYTSDKNFFISGSYRLGGSKGFVMKTDAQGNNLWSYYFGTGETLIWNGIELDDGSLVCVGQTTGYGAKADDILFMKFSANGSLMTSKIIGGSDLDIGMDIIKSSDGNLVIVGNTASFGNDGINVCFVKVDVNGNFISGYTYGSDKEDGWPSVAPDGGSDGFVVGFESNGYDSDSKNIIVVRTDINGKSCCSQKIEDVSVKNISVALNNPGFNNTSRSFITSSNPLQIESADFEDEELCISNLKIIGPDTLACISIANYTISPQVLVSLIWEVPESATIISNVNDTAVTIDFGGESGWIYLLSGNCPADTLDSLFVVLVDGDIPDIALGPDTTFCNGNQINLTPGNNYQSYLWQDGTTDSIYSASQSGTYWVTVTDTSGCKATDSITVETYPAFDYNLGNDTTICDGDYTFLFAPPGYESYLWQDGSDFTSYIADTAGIYWLEVTDTNSCVARDSLKLTVNKVEGFLGPDTSMCEAGSFTLRTNPKYESYFWFDGSNDSVYRVSEKGKYWVTVIDSMGCAGTDTLNLDYFPTLTLTLNSNGYLCEDDSVLLEAISNCNNYLWQDGSQNSTYIAKDSGTYWVRVTNPCETKSDTIVLDACSSIWIPNVFTPNNDGYNDYFYAIGKNIPQFKIEIFNRWGQTLKVLYSMDEKWDGTYRGHKAAEGTYFWVADYEQVNRDGSTQYVRQQGSVTLVR